MSWLANIFWRLWRRWVQRRYRKCIESEVAEEFLQLLLKLMGLAYRLDGDFRRNIEGYKATIQFRSVDDSVTMVARFSGDKLKTVETLVDNADSTLVFKDGRALLNYLLSADRDILKMLLKNEVILTGNLNNVLKFGYMATHLQLALTGELPSH